MTLVKIKGSDVFGRINEAGDIVKAIEENGAKGIEVIKATNEQLEDLLPEIGSVFNKVVDFFESIIVQLPCFITIEGKKYVRTEQRAPWSAVDKVFYLYEGAVLDEGTGDESIVCEKILCFEGKTITEAKAKCRKELKATGRL